VHFEHRLVVNGRDDFGVTLTAEQVWRGLLLRAAQPELFNPNLDRSVVLQHDETGLRRRLFYGDAQFEETLVFLANKSVHARITFPVEHVGSEHLTQIEINDLGELVLKFVYRTSVATSLERTAELEETYKSAYRAADEEVLRTLHELAAEGVI
jgi:hypothetical protein